MIKRLYLILTVLFGVIVLVIYFQNIRLNFTGLYFFKMRLGLSAFLFYISVISFFLGIALTLTVKGFLDGNKDMDDGFDL